MRTLLKEWQISCKFHAGNPLFLKTFAVLANFDPGREEVAKFVAAMLAPPLR